MWINNAYFVSVNMSHATFRIYLSKKKKKVFVIYLEFKCNRAYDLICIKHPECASCKYNANKSCLNTQNLVLT